MKFCYTTYDIGKDSDLEECTQLAHAGGCAGIEFRINDLDDDSPGHRHGIQIYRRMPVGESGAGWRMKILAVITDPDEVKNILRHLMKTGKSPPGLDPAAFPQELTLNP